MYSPFSLEEKRAFAQCSDTLSRPINLINGVILMQMPGHQLLWLEHHLCWYPQNYSSTHSKCWDSAAPLKDICGVGSCTGLRFSLLCETSWGTHVKKHWRHPFGINCCSLCPSNLSYFVLNISTYSPTSQSFQSSICPSSLWPVTIVIDINFFELIIRNRIHLPY